MARSTAAETEVRSIFDRIRQAMLNNDVETLRTFVAEDYRGSDAGGRDHGRDHYLEAYGPGGVKLDEFGISDIDTTSWGDTVLVRGVATIRGRYGEHEFEHTLRFLDVYALRTENWQVVASHVCDIVPE